MKSFADFLAELYDSRFTGKIELDVLNGVPRAVRLPGPKVEFASPVSSKKVDKREQFVETVGV